MTVSELIKYLKTLNQYYIVVVGDSNYPNEILTKKNIEQDNESKTYLIY